MQKASVRDDFGGYTRMKQLLARGGKELLGGLQNMQIWKMWGEWLKRLFK